jgi:hypothetical protein
MRFNPDGNDKYYRNDTIETRIYSDSRTNLLIMISITRNQRAGLIPCLLTSGLIPSLFGFISWVNWFLTRNKSGPPYSCDHDFLIVFINSGQIQCGEDEQALKCENPRYRICGTMWNARIQSSKARKLFLLRNQVASNLRDHQENTSNLID